MESRQLHSAVFGLCGFEDETLVEISGPGNSGKSLVLQQLMAHCLAPYEFGGRQWGVLLINLSHKINRESLTKCIKTELQAFFERTEAGESLPEAELARIAAECMGRVRFLNCFSTEDVATALIDARYAVVDDPDVQLVALDTLGEFYWLDFHKRTEHLSMIQYCSEWQARLEKLCKEAIVCGMYTVNSAHLENLSEQSELLPEVKIKYPVRMEKIQGSLTLNGLPLVFGNGGAKLASQQVSG
ncbi:uncharacterized protein LOC108035790 [Drosophila biarmipes]|uniref:uncharacterized protein LOC108035790 n=1 Tax=Drosophila biarmipes TaxID=125945 RepID=UPI0007E6A6CF|nr:uncharacterized protein LOC108035790 [Drosophila biarmipes]